MTTLLRRRLRVTRTCQKKSEVKRVRKRHARPAIHMLTGVVSRLGGACEVSVSLRVRVSLRVSDGSVEESISKVADSRASAAMLSEVSVVSRSVDIESLDIASAVAFLKGSGSEIPRTLKQFWPMAALQILLCTNSSEVSTANNALMMLRTAPWKYVDAVWKSIVTVVLGRR